MTAERPSSANEQLLCFAESGRLISIDPTRNIGVEGKGTAVAMMVASSATVGIGLALQVHGAQTGKTTALVVGLCVFAIAVTLLAPSIRRVRLHTPASGITIRAGKVLAPEALDPGSWILGPMGWARVDQIGRSRDGDPLALLSSGEVIDLTHPVTVAGGDFRRSAQDRGTQPTRVGR